MKELDDLMDRLDGEPAARSRAQGRGGIDADGGSPG